MPATKDKRTRKNLEVFFIAVKKPSLNEQGKLSVSHHFYKDIVVYYCVHKNCLTYLYSTEDGITCLC